MVDKALKVLVEDSPDSAPFSVVAGIIIVVRTPRSDDFVTVEVGPAAASKLPPADGLGCRPICCSRPAPWVAGGWSGEVHRGEGGSVNVETDLGKYQITLQSVQGHGQWPWASYEFELKKIEGHHHRAGPWRE